jgi:hypothetical protein
MQVRGYRQREFRRLPTTKPTPENLRRLLEALEEVGLERRLKDIT